MTSRRGFSRRKKRMPIIVPQEKEEEEKVVTYFDKEEEELEKDRDKEQEEEEEKEKELSEYNCATESENSNKYKILVDNTPQDSTKLEIKCKELECSNPEENGETCKQEYIKQKLQDRLTLLKESTIIINDINIAIEQVDLYHKNYEQYIFEYFDKWPDREIEYKEMLEQFGLALKIIERDLLICF